jgi:hypothetical protein
MFSKGSSSSISFAIVTPSFVMMGLPKLFDSTTFLPLGPKVILTDMYRVIGDKAFFSFENVLYCIVRGVIPVLDCKKVKTEDFEGKT